MKGLIENPEPKIKSIHTKIINLLAKENLCFIEAIGVLHETETILGKTTYVCLVDSDNVQEQE